MRTCPSCGGIIGRDCFNPEECAWIGEQQERQAQQDLESRIAALENRSEANGEVAQKRAQQIRIIEDKYEELCRFVAFATLALQQTKETPEERTSLFNYAYSMYSKHDVEAIEKLGVQAVAYALKEEVKS